MESWHVSHDFAFQFGGAERVTQQIAAALDAANVTYIAGDSRLTERISGSYPTTILFPKVSRANYRALTPLYPSLLKRKAPVVGNLMCSSYAMSHHLSATGKKIVYCHSPMRQIWSGYDDYTANPRSAHSLGLRVAAPSLRRQDRRAAATADLYLATNEITQRRVELAYGQSAVVIPPPLASCFTLAADTQREDFYLYAGRIVEPYKRVSLLIDAFRHSGRRLVVIGEGRDRLRLEKCAPENVTFIGALGDRELASWMQRSRAVLFPSEDDYGMLPMESISCGTPVIALNAGGARFTVKDEVSGLFFPSATVSAVNRAIDDFEQRTWDPVVVAGAGVGLGEGKFRELIRSLAQGTPSNQ